MQRIEIDKILDRLKNGYGNFWKEYSNFLEEIAKDKNIEFDFLIGEEGIEKIIQNPEFSKNVFDFNWEDRGKKFEAFFKLEKEFKLLLLSNYKFCPICGKTPLIIYNFNNKISQTFDLDHFFPKSKYNFLMFNFYNLVPLCKACNQRKGQINYLRSKKLKVGNRFFHFYFGGFEKLDRRKSERRYFKRNVELKFNFVDGLSDLKSWFNLNHILSFYLENNYNRNDVQEIFNFIYDKYTKIKDEYQRFKKTSKSIEEFVDYFFKNYYPKSEKEILKYSNGKLKKDLIEYLRKVLENGK